MSEANPDEESVFRFFASLRMTLFWTAMIKKDREGKMLNYINLSWKEISRRRRRALYTFSGIFLASALIAFTFLVASSLRGSFGRVLTEVGADIVVQTHGEPCVWAPVKLPTNLNPIPIKMIEETKGIKGVRQAAGILLCWAFQGEQGNLHPAVIAGVEPWERELGPARLSPTEGSGNYIVKGRYLNDLDTYATVIDYDFAKFMKASVGSRIYFGPTQFEIVGILKTGRDARIAGAQAFIPLHIAQEMLQKGKVVDTIFVKLDTDAEPRSVARDLKKLFGENSSVTTSLDFPSMVIGLSAFTNLFTVGMLLFIFVVSVAFSMRSISASISERLKELSVMKAIGWTHRNVRSLILTESAILGGLGSLAGTLSGVLLSWMYVGSIRLRIRDVLAAYPPCSTTPPKLEVAMLGIKLNIMALVYIVIGMTLLVGAASLFVLRGFRKTECAQGIRSL